MIIEIKKKIYFLNELKLIIRKDNLIKASHNLLANIKMRNSLDLVIY